MKSTVREDFGKWDESAIIKGCFIRLPLHLFLMVSFLGTYGILIWLQKYLKYPESIIELFRSKYGRLATAVDLKLIEEYNTKEDITTPIVIANHVNWLDFIYMGACLPRASFVAKIEVLKVPAIRDISKYLQTLYVDRSSPEARHRIKDQIV
jgi:1-acyl-sn-glycerol-3-phosphate acyltransferase